MMRQMNPESLKGMASLLQQYGRKGDTILAHINPREAMLLNNVTDGGSVNPMTGMPEFYDEDEGSDMDGPGIGGAETASSPGTGVGDQQGFDPDADSGEGPGVDPSDSTGEGGSWGYDDVSMDPAPPPGGNPGGAPGDQGSEEGIAGLFNEFMPDNPGILDVLTAPLETLISFFTFGLVDPEFTGKDVFGVPGMSSSDLSRGMAGIPGPQPVGVEFGFSPVGTVGIDKSGVSGYSGPVTDIFSDLMNPDTAKSLVSTDPDLAAQLANEKQSAAYNAALANVQSSSGKAADAIADYLDKARGEAAPGTTTNFYSDPHHNTNVRSFVAGEGPLDNLVDTSPPTSDWNDPANIQAKVDAASAAIAQNNAQGAPLGSSIDQEIYDMTYGTNSLANTISGVPSLAPNQFATAGSIVDSRRGYANGGSVGEDDVSGGLGGGDVDTDVGGQGGDPAEEGDDDEAGGGMGVVEIGGSHNDFANYSKAGEALGDAAIMGTFDPTAEAIAQAGYGVPVDRDIDVSYDGNIFSRAAKQLGKFAGDIVRNPIRTAVDTAIGWTPYGKVAQGVTAALTRKSLANIGSDAIGAYSDVDPMSQTIGTVVGDIFGKDAGEFDPLSETSVIDTQFGINPAFLDYFEGSQDDPHDPRNTPKYAQGGPVSLGSLYNNVQARRGPITGGQRSGGGIMSLR